MILSEEQEMIRDTARSFAQERLAPKAAEWDREARFPRDEVMEMGKLGFLGILIPEEWGGAGADHVSMALATEEVAAGDGGLSTVMSVQNSVTCMPIYRFGTEAQKETYLRPLASGTALGAFCLTEPQAGSDASALKTTARREGNKWVLNGTKQFITSGENADYALVFAVTDKEAGKKGLSAFIVPTDTPGYQVASKERKLGQRTSDTCQIALDDVEVLPDQMLGEEGEGYKIALSNLEGGRIGIAAQSVGMARAALDHAVAYAKERESMGTAIMNHQAVSFRLADAATQVEAARQLVLHAAALRDAGVPCLKECSMAKLFASEMAERVVSDALQTFGGYGYVEGFPLERIYRDVRVCKIYEGTSDIQRLVISRALAA